MNQIDMLELKSIKTEMKKKKISRGKQQQIRAGGRKNVIPENRSTDVIQSKKHKGK